MERWIVFVIRLVLERISPEIQDFITTWLQQADEKAKATDNPFDDLIVDILKFLFMVKLSDDKAAKEPDARRRLA